jgi:photosystem II stability/assembly factor-like uncharacterized protein
MNITPLKLMPSARSFLIVAISANSFSTRGDWTPIGPKGGFDGGSAGRICSIQVQPFGGGHYVYIGASGGGLWRANGVVGPVWQSLGENLPNSAVGAIAVHPLNPDDILVGTGDYLVYQGNGLYHTTNAGQAWTKVNLPCEPTYCFRILYRSGNLDVILAATDCGLFRSASGPNGPWTTTLSGFISDLVIHPANPDIQFCAKNTSPGSGMFDGGIYKSVDGGRTWNFLITGTAAYAFDLARIAICRDQPNVVAFVNQSGGGITDDGSSGVHLSGDGGANWNNITHGIGFTTYNRALAIAIRPDNPSVIVVGANDIARSVDGGQTWEEPRTPGSDRIKGHQDQTQFYFSFVTGDNFMWECNDGGVFKVDLDSSTFESWNGTAAGNLSIATIADMDARGAVRGIGNQDDGAAYTPDAGSSWDSFGTCCDVYSVAITDTPEPAFWYVPAQQFGGLGQVWKHVLSSASYNVGEANISFNRLVFDPFSSRVFSLATETNRSLSLVSRPTTGAPPWIRELMNLSPKIGGIAGNPLNGRSLYLWQNEPPGVVTVLTKSGASWNQTPPVTIGGGPNGLQIGIMVASPDRPRECWAGLSTQYGQRQLGGYPLILHTTDDWQTSNSLSRLPLRAGQVTGIAVTPLNTRQIFVATDVGVFSTQDGGLTWQPFQAGLPQSVYCTGIKYVERSTPAGDDTLVLATWGRGMYETLPLRHGVVYVDKRNSGTENGTIRHPFNSLIEGINATPEGGTMALNGATIYQSTGFTKPMTITAYEFPSQLHP